MERKLGMITGIIVVTVMILAGLAALGIRAYCQAIKQQR